MMQNNIINAAVRQSLHYAVYALHNQYITHAATQLNNCIQLGLTFNQHSTR